MSSFISSHGISIQINDLYLSHSLIAMQFTLERVKCSDIWCAPPSDSNDLVIYQIVLPLEYSFCRSPGWCTAPRKPCFFIYTGGPKRNQCRYSFGTTSRTLGDDSRIPPQGRWDLRSFGHYTAHSGIPYRRLGTTYRSHLQGSINPIYWSLKMWTLPSDNCKLHRAKHTHTHTIYRV